jgi:AbiV family abortive infection protein
MERENEIAGAKLAAENARGLYESALVVSGIGNNGCAAALMVLCAEESAKAITLRFGAKEASHKKITKLFYSHRHKHSKAAQYSTLIHQFISLTQDRREGKPIHGECGVVEVIDKWGKTADDTKKNGFYVDYQNGFWITPKEVGGDVYEVAKFQAETLLSFAESFFGKDLADG